MTAEHRTGKDIFDGAITAAYERAVYLLQEANDMQPMKGLLYSRLDTHHLQNGITIHIERRPGNPDALLQIVCPKDTNGAWEVARFTSPQIGRAAPIVWMQYALPPANSISVGNVLFVPQHEHLQIVSSDAGDSTVTAYIGKPGEAQESRIKQRYYRADESCHQPDALLELTNGDVFVSESKYLPRPANGLLGFQVSASYYPGGAMKRSTILPIGSSGYLDEATTLQAQDLLATFPQNAPYMQEMISTIQNGQFGIYPSSMRLQH